MYSNKLIYNYITGDNNKQIIVLGTLNHLVVCFYILIADKYLHLLRILDVRDCIKKNV